MCKYFDKKIKKLKCTDMQLIKLSVIAFTLMIAKLWSGILALDWYYYLIFMIIFAIVPIIKIFK